MVIDREVGILDMWDTAGQAEYNPLQGHYMRTCEGFVMVYDITSHPSFDEIPSFRTRVMQMRDHDHFPSDVPCVLVGNKCDLDTQRAVTVAEGAQLAKTMNCTFFETSAKTGVNVEEIFFTLVREIRKVRGRRNEIKVY